MDIQPDSKIVMITSAGCNALDYLLDTPSEIHCVDMNYRQNALLELKKASFTKLTHEDCFALFGKGQSKEAKSIYQNTLRTHLSSTAQQYWDKYIKYFSGSGLRKSFYYRGTSGLLAYSVMRFLRLRSRIRKNLEQLFRASNLEEQTQYFGTIEKLIFSNKLIQRVFNSHYALTLAGVPQSQQYLMKASYEGGILEYIQDSFRKIFTTLDISQNYFYHVYVNGYYTTACCPEYLKAENHTTLRAHVGRIGTYTTTISSFLKDNPGQYSHFVLLDHQDWLAENDHDALVEEWSLILANSKPGTKILMRSAAKEIDFFPDFVKEQVHFDTQKAADTHHQDRVGTYASVYIGVVK